MAIWPSKRKRSKEPLLSIREGKYKINPKNIIPATSLARHHLYPCLVLLNINTVSMMGAYYLRRPLLLS
jgi:hypothetical protein